MPPKGTCLKKELRIFLFANPGEFDVERTIIHDVVVPQLRQHCHDEFNIDLLVVDPFQTAIGVKCPTPDTRTMMGFLEECLEISDGPASLILLGEKYAEKGAPGTLSEEHFEAVIADLKSKNDSTWIAIQKRYLPLVESVPPLYQLDRTGLPVDEELTLLKAIRQSVSAAVTAGQIQQVDVDNIMKTDMEIVLDRLMSDKNSLEKSVCVSRQIKDIKAWSDQVDSLKSLFLDLDSDKNVIEPAHKKVEELRDLVMKKFPREHTVKLSVNATSLIDYKEFYDFKIATKNRGAKAPLIIQKIADMNLSKEVSQDFMSTFAKLTYDKMKYLVTRQVKRKEYIADKLYREIECHKALIEEAKYPEKLYNRERELKILNNYLSSQSARTPGLLYGESGAGKTTLLKYALKKISQLHAAPIIVVRSCGRTCNSSTLQGILATMTEEISRPFKALFTKPFEYATCVYDFWRILQMASGKRPIFVLLDDAEQLFPQSHTEMYRWLPHRLPPYVKVLLSTSHENMYAGFKRRYDEGGAVTVPGISTAVLLKEFPEKVRAWGKKTDEKSDSLANHLFQQNSLPLFSDVLAAVLPCKDDKLPDRIKLIFMKFIEQLETTHSVWLTKYLLSYLSSARFGLSLVEIVDLMSLDNFVCQDCGLNMKFCTTFRLPITLVLNFLKKISVFTVVLMSEDRYLYTFRHESIRSAITDYYQLNKEFGVLIHAQMADYFSGKWGGTKAKPLFEKMTDNDESKTINLDRQVLKMPYYWLAGAGQQGMLTCDARKLSELPLHLMRGDRVQDLFKQALFCFDYLYAKLALTSVNDLVSEMYFVRQVYEVKVNNELEVLIALLRLLAPVLEKDADYLGPEICGRLCHLVGQQPLISVLIQQADAYGPKVNCLLPTIPCYPTLDAEEMRVPLPKTKGTVLSTMSPDNRFLATLFPLEVDLMLFTWDSKSATKSQIINLGSYKNTTFQKIMYMPQSDEHVILQFKTDANIGYWFVNLNIAKVENKVLFPLDTKLEVLYLSKSFITLRVNGQIKIYNYFTAEVALEYRDLPWPFYFTPSDKYIVAPRPKTTSKMETNLRLINMQTGDNACILECSLQAASMFANNRNEVLWVGCKSYGVIYKFDISQVIKRDIRKMKPSVELNLETQEHIPEEIKSMFKKYKSQTSVVSLTTSLDEKFLLAEYNINDIRNIYVVWGITGKNVQLVILKLANDKVRFATDGSYVYQFVPYSASYTSLIVFNCATSELVQESVIGQSIMNAYVMKQVLLVLPGEIVLTTLKKLEEETSQTELQVHQYANAFVSPEYNPEINIVYGNNPQLSDFSYFNLDSNQLYSVDMSHKSESLTRFPFQRHISPDGTKLVLSYESQSHVDRMNRQRGSISSYIMTPPKGESHLIQNKTDYRKPEIPGVNYFIGESSVKAGQTQSTKMKHEVIYEQRILRVIDTSNGQLICQVSLSGECILQVTNQFILTFKPDYASMTRDSLAASDIITLYDLSTGAFESSVYLENSVRNCGLVDNKSKLLVCCGKNGKFAKILGGKNFDKTLLSVDVEAIMKTFDEYARSVIVKKMHIFHDNVNCVLLHYCWKETDKEILYAKVDLVRKDVCSHFTAVDVIQDVSRDGRWAIDCGLRLYDLNRGDLMKQLNLTLNFDFENINCISKFTDDSQFIIVLDNNDRQLYVIHNDIRTQMFGKALLHPMKLANNDGDNKVPYDLSTGQVGKVIVVHNEYEFKVFVLKDNSKLKRIQEIQYHNVTERARHLIPKKTFNNIDTIFGRRMSKDSRMDESPDVGSKTKRGSRKSPGAVRRTGGASRTPTSPTKDPSG